jgi:hypothetical protein
MSGFRVYQLEDSPLWAVSASYYSPKLNREARSVPGARWNTQLRAHVGYIDAIEQVVARMHALGLRSEDTPPNKREWPHNLPVSYDGAREYQKEGIDFLVNQAGSGALLADDMGCVDGDARVAVRRDRYGSARIISLAGLHEEFHQDGRRKPLFVQALCGGTFRFHAIRDVLDKGVRPVVQLVLKTTGPLRLTADHEVGVLSGLAQPGFLPASELRVGGNVLVVGRFVGYRQIKSGAHGVRFEKSYARGGDKIVSVEPDGEAHVYDIVCEDPHRNFVANGIVVHNCGKSFQAVKAARALRRKTVIVCPAHVRGVWERSTGPAGSGDPGGELAKWWPKANVFKPYGLKPQPIPSDADVVVIHYDIIHAWVEALLKWSNGDLTFIADEAHILLSASSRRSKACRELAHAARGRVALTGTPPTERVRDLYNIVDTISPGRFGDFFPFGLRFCAGAKIDVPGPGGTLKTVWAFEGKSNLKELRQRLDWFCLRRTKREVLKELPALQRQVVDVEVPARNRISMNARLVGDKRRMRMALDSAADGKLKSVLALAAGHLEAGQRVVVGTYRRAVCEKIADALGEVAPTKFIHGGVPLPRRSKIIDELRKTEGACCLVANIDCASTGIDLTFAGVVVMAELVWEPRDLVQFEARCHRFGASETEPVLVQYVIARGTGDELILQAVVGKLDNFLELVETDAGDGLKETLVGKDEGLARLAAALKKMGRKAA